MLGNVYSQDGNPVRRLGIDESSQPPGAPGSVLANALGEEDDGAASGRQLRQIDDSHPVILAVKDSNPTTPSELINATETMFNIGRPDQAQVYLDSLIAAGLDDAALYRLQQEKGTAFFLELFRSRTLTPEANAFARQVLEAAYVEARDPTRLDQLVQDLSSTSTARRDRAMFSLKELGESAVAPLLLVLGDEGRQSEHKTAARALYELRGAATEPLIGALRASNPTVRQAAIEVLGRQRVNQATPAMVFSSVSPNATDLERRIARDALVDFYGVAPTAEEAQIYIRDRLDAFLNGAVPGTPDLNNLVTMWLWDEDAKVTVPVEVTPRLSSLLVASDLAADLYLLAPENIEVQRLYLGTLIETEKRSLGLNVPLTDTESVAVAKDFGTERVEEVLLTAMDEERPVAAAGAAEILGMIGTPDLLASRDGRPRTLVNALRHGDRRLRFAATMAIVNLNPTMPYAGSNYLMDSLIYFISSGGDRRVLIGHPRLGEAQTLAGALGQFGYVCDVAPRGRQTFKMAAEHSDYEIVLISDTLSGPDANELVQQLRRDPRTSKLPIGLLTRYESIDRARRIAFGDPLTLAMPWPYDEQAVQLTAVQLSSAAGFDFVDPTRRLIQAARALDGLKYILANSEDLAFYDVRSHEEQVVKALYTPELTANVAQFLGMSGSPRAQLELVNLASQPLFPIASRQAAVDALTVAVAERGVLLTSTDVLQQYDRYNQSAGLDRDTQQILGAILDVLEMKYRNQASTTDQQ